MIIAIQTSAEPTKLISAMLAGHMVASFRFLNQGLTFWTFLDLIKNEIYLVITLNSSTACLNVVSIAASHDRLS
jgi:hypothetical protein